MCTAINSLGEAIIICSVTVEGKAGLCLDTLDQQRLQKITELENYSRPTKEEAEQELQRPIFTTPLQNLEDMKEGDHAHLECRLKPINDPKMRVEWYVNGMAIRTGHRFRATHDFGYVVLDVLYTYPKRHWNLYVQGHQRPGRARQHVHHPGGVQEVDLL